LVTTLQRLVVYIYNNHWWVNQTRIMVWLYTQELWPASFESLQIIPEISAYPSRNLFLAFAIGVFRAMAKQSTSFSKGGPWSGLHEKTVNESVYPYVVVFLKSGEVRLFSNWRDWDRHSPSDTTHFCCWTLLACLVEKLVRRIVPYLLIKNFHVPWVVSS